MSTTYRALEARPSTFDELLEACGGCGRYQIRLLLIIGALCGTSGALGLSFYFIGRAVPLRCPRSGDAGDFDDDDDSCAAVHTDDGDEDLCDWYSEHGLGSSDWAYASPSQYTYNSWVSELRFSCDRAYLGELMVSLYFAGSGVGAWGFGKVADARGRLPVAKAMAALLIVCQLLSAAASQVWWLAVLRFGTGVGVGGQLSSAYNLLVEQVGAARRCKLVNQSVSQPASQPASQPVHPPLVRPFSIV